MRHCEIASALLTIQVTVRQIKSFVSALRDTEVAVVQGFPLLKSLCLEITWYFAVLIQLCLVGTAVIFVLQRRFFVGVVLNASLVAVGIISMGVLTATYKLPPTVLFAQADINSRLTMEDIMYQKPWAHLGPFCIGIGLACIVTRKPVVTLNP
ncbi:hypothetical protein V5799_027994, partial [Amblyomma americanum]